MKKLSSKSLDLRSRIWSQLRKWKSIEELKKQIKELAFGDWESGKYRYATYAAAPRVVSRRPFLEGLVLKNVEDTGICMMLYVVVIDGFR